MANTKVVEKDRGRGAPVEEEASSLKRSGTG
jgi:hypothetical protein